MAPKQTPKKETALATYDQMRMKKNFSLGTAGIDPSDVMPSMVKLVQGTTDLDRVKDNEGNPAKVGQFFFYGDKSILDTIEGYVLNLAKVNDPYNKKDNGQPEKMYRVIGIFSDLLTPFVMYFRRGAINTVKNLLGNVFANLRGVYTFRIQIKTEQKKGEKGNYMTPVISIVEKENESQTLELLEKEARKYEYLSKMAGGEDFIDTKPAEILPAPTDEPVDPTKPLKENVNPDDIPF